MGEELPEELNFLEKLNRGDRERFYQKTEEQKKRAVTENKIAKEEEELRHADAAPNQLTDRIASKSFQG